MTGDLHARARALEPVAAALACVVAAWFASRRLLQDGVYSADAFVHQYWMRSYRDPALFTDPLTAELRASARYPEGYEGLMWLASRVADPIAFGEWLGVALMALSGWLIFRIVRELEPWRPAAWIGGALFLSLVDLHRFHGGFPRAFVHPVVLATVLLAIRGQRLPAALVAGAGALLYPPAAVLAAGVLVLAAVGWRERRPHLDARRLAFGALALALTAAAVLVPQLLTGGAPRVMTAAEARAFPEFGPQGTLHVFVASPLDYLRQNRTGFDLRANGSLLLLAALALLAVRPANLRLLRAEVLAMPVAALGAFAAAQAVLFRLYLPHRYTYPLVAFAAIVVAVALRPTWTALWARRPSSPAVAALLLAPLALAALALFAFPLGPLEPLPAGLPGRWVAVAAGAGALAIAGALALARAPRGRAPAVAAALTGATLLALLVVVPDEWGRNGTACRSGPAIEALAALPKDAIVAGDPADLACLPATARRAVVTSTQLAPSYEAQPFRRGRARMFATLRAVYGSDPDAVVGLRERYGVTHLWLRRDAIAEQVAGTRLRWRPGRRPYGRFVAGLARRGPPASLDLPAACRRWQRGGEAIYDVGCLATAPPAVGPRAPGADR